jgi:uncharacterized membrane protein/mono/diheme cytochrome c family protein
MFGQRILLALQKLHDKKNNLGVSDCLGDLCAFPSRPLRLSLGLALLLASSSAPAQTAQAEPPEILTFLGRFHPLLVHIPIGFLFVAFMLEVFSRFQRYRELRHAVTFILLLGTVSAVATAVMGYFLSLSGGYEADTLFWHQWLGIGVAALSVLAYVLKVNADRRPAFPGGRVYFPVFVLAVFLTMGAGHYGGALTHGSDYLTQYMPQPLRTLAGLPPRQKPVQSKPITNLAEAVVYRDIIHPIVETRCVNCHNPNKMKGDLRMDRPEQLVKGGESGPLFVAGNAEGSEMVKRLLLPEEHDDHMPPKGKSQLTKEQVELIRWWIDGGASFDKTVAQFQATPEVKVMLARLTNAAPAENAQGVMALKVPPAPSAVVTQLRKVGMSVMPVAQGSNLLQVKWWKKAEAAGTEPFVLLPKMAQQVTWLDLSNAQLAAEAWNVLPSLKNLSRLHLQQSNATDAVLVKLKGLSQLEYLNLYGTAVTDAGLKHLEGLSGLKALYLWQTQVTPEGVRQLQQKLPGLRVDRGWEEKVEKAAAGMLGLP